MVANRRSADVLERVVLGDNQFFGVNHMSEAKAAEQAARFSDISRVIKVIDDAVDCGVNVFMCTTQERVELICQHVRQHQDTFRDFSFYPCMPYAHKYANAVTDFGLFGAIRRAVPANSNLISTIFRGGASIARRDATAIGNLLVDAEMRMFSGLHTPIIFLQNVVTDLILGLGLWDFFAHFAEHVESRYGAKPGFITMNLPKLCLALDRVGIVDPVICSSINKIGFRMCGGNKVYEDLISEGRFQAMAMSVFASGAIRPKEALEYVAKLKNVRSIVFGASSREHIMNNKSMIEQLDGVYGSKAA